MSLFQRDVDTFPNIKAAGKVITQGEGALTCLQEITPRPVTPPAVRKFLNSRYPEPGRIRVCYGKADDPDIASSMVHGKRIRTSLSARSLINPPPKTHFQEWFHEHQEAVYGKKAPLGRSQIKGPGLPNDVDLEKTTFGIKSPQSSGAGEIINPPKTAEQVEKEAQKGHECYVRSHNSYFVGEHVNRSYDVATFRKDRRFGLATPHHHDGRRAAASLQWLCDMQKNCSAKFISKQYDDFRERKQLQIGKVHDLSEETELQGSEEKPGSGVLVKPDDLEPVKEGSTLKKSKPLSRGGTEPGRVITSSSEICAVVGDLPPPEDYRTYGVPSVRTDRPAPRIKRVSDRTNYGDQATVSDLLFPPLYSVYGVHREDFLCPRTKDEMEQILHNAGIHISSQMFEKVWSLASVRRPAGDVCVQSFQDILNELQTNEN